MTQHSHQTFSAIKAKYPPRMAITTGVYMMIGAPGSGKSTFVHNMETLHPEVTVLSSDAIRAELSTYGSEADQTVSAEAFEELYRRLRHALRFQNADGSTHFPGTIFIDSTGLNPKIRKKIHEICKQYHYKLYALITVYDPEEIEHLNKARDRVVPDSVMASMLKRQKDVLSNGLLKKGHKMVLKDLPDVEVVQDVVPESAFKAYLTEAKEIAYMQRSGRYDVIGDIHGCFDELLGVLTALGYRYGPDEKDLIQAYQDCVAKAEKHFTGHENDLSMLSLAIDDLTQNLGHEDVDRRIVFAGDITDRGNKNIESLIFVQSLVDFTDTALIVDSNHDNKLLRFLKGNKVKIGHGLEKTVAELQEIMKSSFGVDLNDFAVCKKSGDDIVFSHYDIAKFEAELERKGNFSGSYFLKDMRYFLERHPSHLVLDKGRLVVSHAGLAQKYHGRISARVRDLAQYGETIKDSSTGQPKKTPDGYIYRKPIYESYSGKALQVHGHDIVPGYLEGEVASNNNVINIDTGCYAGGALTGFRYPEGEIFQFSSGNIYCER